MRVAGFAHAASPEALARALSTAERMAARLTTVEPRAGSPSAGRRSKGRARAPARARGSGPALGYEGVEIDSEVGWRIVASVHPVERAVIAPAIQAVAVRAQAAKRVDNDFAGVGIAALRLLMSPTLPAQRIGARRQAAPANR